MEAAWELKQAVADYRAGRQEAFTMLYERSSKYIYTCIYKVMQGNENIQDAIGDRKMISWRMSLFPMEHTVQTGGQNWSFLRTGK